jgi:hypothetical protein
MKNENLPGFNAECSLDTMSIHCRYIKRSLHCEYHKITLQQVPGQPNGSRLFLDPFPLSIARRCHTELVGYFGRDCIPYCRTICWPFAGVVSFPFPCGPPAC